MHDHHHSGPYLWLTAAAGFIGRGFQQLAASGLDWPTAALLVGGLGSCLIGLKGCSAEARQWYQLWLDRRRAGRP